MFRLPARRHAGWLPPALRWWILVIATLLCWTFIALLLTFFKISRANGGIIFAPKINDLPLRQTFVYLYLPTIIATIFSVFIVWIDVDAKRFEPYRQLSMPNGARGKDSLLLHYPYDLLPVVPFKALRNRHWLTFWASLATVITTFGVVPIQAGIFSTTRLSRTSEQTFKLSTDFIPASTQDEALSLAYAQSAYGILALNETLPPMMALNYTLKPFRADDRATRTGIWTANTTLYTMDVNCQKSEPEVIQGTSGQVYRSGQCELSTGSFNNLTVGVPPPWSQVKVAPWANPKQFSALYIPSKVYEERYFGLDWKLGHSFCGNRSEQAGNDPFFAALVRNKLKETDPSNPVTALFCRPAYYEQEVEATVDARTGSPISIVPLHSKRPLAPNIFNRTVFERTIATGQRQVKLRDNVLPVKGLPRYLQKVYAGEYLTPAMLFTGELPPMLAMAIMTSKHKVEELLDSHLLAEAYENAYRLLFVRAMTDILATDFGSSVTTTTGRQSSQEESIVLEPIFTLLVVALLAAVSISMLALLYVTSFSGGTTLAEDPGTIAGVMSLVADNGPLLASFEDLSYCSTKHLQEKVRHRTYKLGSGIFEPRTAMETTAATLKLQQQTPMLEKAKVSQVVELLRPAEFSSYTVFPVTFLFVAFMVILAALYQWSKRDGMPLPNGSRFVQNLVREYVPVAIAALIEPGWILVNRLLCMLQPLETLRESKAKASESIALNYSSLPPQLMLLRAIRAGHLMLATVCAMALLANLLAVAFAGLLFQETVTVYTTSASYLPYVATFRKVNGTIGPPMNERPTESNLEFSGAWQGSTGEDHFLVAESNYTRNTTFPSWSDASAMYLPIRPQQYGVGGSLFDRPKELLDTTLYHGSTKYFAAQPNCQPLVYGKDYQLRLWNTTDGKSNPKLGSYIQSPRLNVTVPDKDGNDINCVNVKHTEPGFFDGLGSTSRDWRRKVCRSGKTAAELLTVLKAPEGATPQQQEICASAVAVGWMRLTLPECPEEGDDPEDRINLHGLDIDALNVFLMRCQPSVYVGDATLTVDAAGVLQEPATRSEPDPSTNIETHFSNGMHNVVGQSNRFIFRGLLSSFHNDTYASEPFHYFVNRATAHLRFTNPELPLPTFSDVEKPLNAAYARLFAIWLSVNQPLLFTGNRNISATAEVEVRTLEERLFFNTPMFIISETILVIYAIVAILVYFKRPGRYLPRMPTTIASVIALFAASAAVKDFERTSMLTVKEREKRMEESGCRYGYGSFVGGDGCLHVGIEKVPFVHQNPGEKKGEGAKQRLLEDGTSESPEAESN